MSRVIVEVETDHTDHDEAVRSVMNGLKRAGYDVLDYMVPGETHGEAAIQTEISETVAYSDMLFVKAAEPETDARMRR